MSPKAPLRNWAKQMRANLAVADLSLEVCHRLAAFLERRACRHVLSYSAFATEINLDLLQTLYTANYYLSRVENENLYIHPLPAKLIRHKYGMLEPDPSSPTVNPERLEAVLVPGLAFDRQGYRLGYGKGFYDRFLANLTPNVLTIGIVPEALKLENLPIDTWDMPVQYLASELGVQAVL